MLHPIDAVELALGPHGMNDNAESSVAFPLTVRFEDGSEEIYADVKELERELEYFDSEKSPQCYVRDASGRPVRLTVEALELLVLEVSPSSTSPRSRPITDNQAGNRVLLLAVAAVAGITLSFGVASVLENAASGLSGKAAFSLVFLVPFIADRFYVGWLRRKHTGTEGP